MKTINKVLRYLVLTLFLLCASFGLAFGAVLFSGRFQAHDKETSIEAVVKKEDDDHEEEDLNS